MVLRKVAEYHEKRECSSNAAMRAPFVKALEALLASDLAHSGQGGLTCLSAVVKIVSARLVWSGCNLSVASPNRG